MPFTESGLNAAANGIASVGAHISAHTADPGTTGANQHGTRSQTTWGAAAAGDRAGSQVTIAVATGTTVSHWGLWTAATGGTFLGGWALTAPETFGSAGELKITPTIDID